MSSGAGVDLRTSPPSPSPSSRRHHHHHHHNSRHHHRHHEQPSTRRHHNHSQDSGRSSDSSVSHSRTSLESTGYRLLDSPHRHQHQQRTIAQQQVISSQSSRQPSGSLEIRSHKSGTLEGVKNQKLLASVDTQPLGLSLSTSTPLFKKKTFTEPQRESRAGNLDLDKSKNGKNLCLPLLVFESKMLE